MYLQIADEKESRVDYPASVEIDYRSYPIEWLRSVGRVAIRDRILQGDWEKKKKRGKAFPFLFLSVGLGAILL